MDEQERCVYVKQAVLSQLEREKRGLKWQLARTIKLADTRAADVAVCEAKVKDLLTIIELNKSVADRAIKRAYSHEAALQRIASERDALQQQLAHQHKRFIDHSLRRLQQRGNWRRQRTAFDTLAAVIAWRRDMRKCIHRVAALRRRVCTATALGQWQRVCHTTAAASVHPLPCAAATDAPPDAPSPTTFLFDERFRVRFARRCERQRRSFFAWKADWTCAKMQHCTAERLCRLTVRRCLQRILCAWATVTQRTARQRTLLRRIVQTQHRAQLQQSFTRLCLRCAERSAVEWTLTLRTAHAALEDEKVAYKLHQDAALRELYARCAAQDQQARMCIAQHNRRVRTLTMQKTLQRRFAAWRMRTTARQLCCQLATHVHNVQHSARVLRRHFSAWRNRAARQLRVRQWRVHIGRNQQHQLLARVVSAWHVCTTREVAKQRRLRALASRVAHVLLLQSWSQWRCTITLDEQRASVAYDANTYVQQLQQRVESDATRSNKCVQRLQLACALSRRDSARTQVMRQLVQAWRAYTRTVRTRRRALRRVLQQCMARVERQSIARWRQQSAWRAAVHQTLEQRALHRMRCCLCTLFQQWRRSAQTRKQQRLHRSRLRLYVALWRVAVTQQRKRLAALQRVLTRVVVRGWSARAFRRWQCMCELSARTCAQREQQQRDLCVRIWRAWCTFVTHRLRCRVCQVAAVGATTAVQQRHTTQRAVLQCWRLLVQHCRIGVRAAHCMGMRGYQQRLQLRVVTAWRLSTRSTQQQRMLLARAVRRSAVRLMQTAWRCWTAYLMDKQTANFVQHRALAYAAAVAKRLVARYALERSLKRWRTWLRTMQHSRHASAYFAKRCRTALLAHSVRQWRDGFLGARTLLQRLLRRRIQLVQRAALARAFKHWEHVLALHTLRLESTVSCILLDDALGCERALTVAAHAKYVLQASLSTWQRCVASSRVKRQALRRAVVAVAAQHKRLTWRQWQIQTRLYQQLQCALATIVRLIYRCKVRVHWHTWRRCVALTAQQQVHARMQTAIESLACRQHSRRQQRWCFVAWRRCVAVHQRMCVLRRDIQQRRDAAVCRTSFQRWRKCTALRRTRRTRLQQLVARCIVAATRAALHRWRLETRRVTHSVVLKRTQRELQRYRMTSALRVAHALYIARTRSLLAASVASWRAYTWTAKRVRCTILEQFVRRHCERNTARVLRAWHECVHVLRTRTQCWQRVVMQRVRRLRVDAFRQWRTRVEHRSTLLRALANFTAIFAKTHLRCSFRHLEQQLRMHQQQQLVLKRVVVFWRIAAVAVTHRRVVVCAMQRRVATRRLQRILFSWRAVSKRSHVQRRLVHKQQVAIQQRRLRTFWRRWRAFTTRSQHTKRFVFDCMATRRASRAVESVWRVWCRATQQMRTEVEQQRAAASAAAAHKQQSKCLSLEHRNAGLLRDCTRLEQHVRNMQQRSVAAFSSKLAAVVLSHCVRCAFATWRHRTHLLQLLQTLLATRLHRSRAVGFHIWRLATDALRAQTTRKQQQKRIATLLSSAQQASNRVVVRCCWTTWRARAARQQTLRAVVQARCIIRKQHLQQRVLLCWRLVHQTTRNRQKRVHVLLAYSARTWRQQQLAIGWRRWLQHCAAAAVMRAHAQLVTRELAHWNATCRNKLNALSARAFTTWRCAARAARAWRNAQLETFTTLQRTSCLRAYLFAWRDQLPARQRHVRPVLCIQTSLARRCSRDRVLYCSYREYRRRYQSRWRLVSTRNALRRHTVRMLALSLLLRAVHRQHVRALHCAFWRWFVAGNSAALGTSANLALLPHNHTTTGSMLLRVLDELHVVQQQHQREQRSAHYRMLGCIKRGQQQRRVQRAFDYMAVAARMRRCTTKWPLAVRRDNRAASLAVRRDNRAASLAAVRAGAQVLAATAVRRAFRNWKREYVAAALQSAESAQSELLRALHDVTSYRETLGPYTGVS